jgi:CheY-like chemotaxis protein
MDDYASKPVNPAKLEEILDRWVMRRWSTPPS